MHAGKSLLALTASKSMQRSSSLCQGNHILCLELLGALDATHLNLTASLQVDSYRTAN